MSENKKKSGKKNGNKKGTVQHAGKPLEHLDAPSEDKPKRYEEIHFVDSTKNVWNYSLFTEQDIENFQRGTHYNAYNFFGSHGAVVLETPGFYFSVWAPNATFVSVIGNFNDWNKQSHPLFVRLDHSGIWEGFIPNLQKGESYKYHIHGFKGVPLDKGVPPLLVAVSGARHQIIY